MRTHVESSELVQEDRVSEFNKLMEASYRKVFNMAYRLSGNRADADDLTQETYFRAFQSFDQYEGGRPFENWVLRIVTRLFLDMIRNRGRRVRTVSFDSHVDLDGDGVPFEFPDQRPGPEDQLFDRVLSEEFQDVLASLTEGQRSLVMLADIDELNYSEISQKFHRPVGTIRSRLHRAHKVLRRGLEQAYPGQFAVRKPRSVALSGGGHR